MDDCCNYCGESCTNLEEMEGYHSILHSHLPFNYTNIEKKELPPLQPNHFYKDKPAILDSGTPTENSGKKLKNYARKSTSKINRTFLSPTIGLSGPGRPDFGPQKGTKRKQIATKSTGAKTGRLKLVRRDADESEKDGSNDSYFSNYGSNESSSTENNEKLDAAFSCCYCSIINHYDVMEEHLKVKHRDLPFILRKSEGSVTSLQEYAYKCAHCECENMSLMAAMDHWKSNHFNLDFKFIIILKKSSPIDVKPLDDEKVHSNTSSDTLQVFKLPENNRPTPSVTQESTERGSRVKTSRRLSLDALENNAKKLKLDVKTFKCHYCKKTANKKSEVNSHIKAVHKGKPIRVRVLTQKSAAPHFECETCEFGGIESEVEKHYAEKHPVEFPSLKPHVEPPISKPPTEEVTNTIIFNRNYCGESCTNLEEMEAHHSILHSHLPFNYTNIEKKELPPLQPNHFYKDKPAILDSGTPTENSGKKLKNYARKSTSKINRNFLSATIGPSGPGRPDFGPQKGNKKKQIATKSTGAKTGRLKLVRRDADESEKDGSNDSYFSNYGSNESSSTENNEKLDAAFSCCYCSIINHYDVMEEHLKVKHRDLPFILRKSEGSVTSLQEYAYKCAHCECENMSLMAAMDHWKSNHFNLDFKFIIILKKSSPVDVKPLDDEKVHSNTSSDTLQVFKLPENNRPTLSVTQESTERGSRVKTSRRLSLDALENNAKKLKLDVKTFKCHYCKKTANKKSEVNSHIKAVHKGKPIRVRILTQKSAAPHFECEICEFGGIESEVEKHYAEKHPVEFPSLKPHVEPPISKPLTEEVTDTIIFNCNYCGESCTNLEEMEAHHSILHSHLPFYYTNIEKKELPPLQPIHFYKDKPAILDSGTPTENSRKKLKNYARKSTSKINRTFLSPTIGPSGPGRPDFGPQKGNKKKQIATKSTGAKTGRLKLVRRDADESEKDGSNDSYFSNYGSNESEDVDFSNIFASVSLLGGTPMRLSYAQLGRILNLKPKLILNNLYNS